MWLQLSSQIIPKDEIDGVNYEDLVAWYRVLGRPAVHLIEPQIAVTPLKTESKHEVLLDGMELPSSSEPHDTFLSS